MARRLLKALVMKTFALAATLVPSVLVALFSASLAHADELPTLPAPGATAAPVAPEAVPVVPAAEGTAGAPAASPAASTIPAPATPTPVAKPTKMRPSPEAEEPAREWYGYQTLLVDIAGIGMGVGAAGGGYPLAITGLATYLVGGPIVHAAHGNGAKVAIDIGVRLGAPTAGAITGGLIACAGGCRGDFGALAGVAGGLFGAGIGAVTAIVIDAAVLAREPAERRATEAKWDGKPVVRPEVSSLPGGGAVGLSGAF